MNGTLDQLGTTDLVAICWCKIEASGSYATKLPTSLLKLEIKVQGGFAVLNSMVKHMHLMQRLA